MSIRRGYVQAVDHFTITPNEWVRDERLSFKARGVLTYLLSHREGWIVSVRSLVEQGKEGREAITGAVQELEALGYLTREKARTEGGRIAGMDYVVTNPGVAGKPLAGKPSNGEPSDGNPTPKKTSSSKDQIQEDQHCSTAVAVSDPNAGQLVGEWIDACSHRPPSRVIGQVSKEVKALVTDKVPADVIRRSIVAWQERGLHPSTLASVAHELMNASPTRGRMGKQAQQQAETDAFFDRAMARARAADAAEAAGQLTQGSIW